MMEADMTLERAISVCQVDGKTGEAAKDLFRIIDIDLGQVCLTDELFASKGTAVEEILKTLDADKDGAEFVKQLRIMVSVGLHRIRWENGAS